MCKALNDDELKQKQRKALAICRAIMNEYGTRIHHNRLPPVDQLVITVLAQNTTDITAERAFQQLKSDFTDWSEVMNASHERIAESISHCGLHNLKAKRIKAILTEIHSRTGGFDLSLLKDMDIEDAKAWLTSLHGVGPKTAAIVLLFSFGLPVIPVDTHVFRITKRLGLIPENTTRERAHILLDQIVTDECMYSFNYNLVQHGRKVCRALKPHCFSCILSNYCEHYQSH